MKIKHRLHNGETRYIVDGKINGKRKREQFNTKRQAELFIKAQHKEPTIAAWWSELTLSERVDIHAAHNRAKEDGFSLLSAVETHAVQGLGKTHLKKMTLKEAVGYAGKDKRWKNDPNERQPCGFLGDKLLANISQGSINTLRCGLVNFMRFAGPDLQCRAVSPELIKSWLISGGDKESHWESKHAEALRWARQEPVQLVHSPRRGDGESCAQAGEDQP